MGLNIMTAGCSPDERRQLESTIKQALGSQMDSGDWNVSLVRIGSSFSVSIDGPEPRFRGINFMAPADELQRSVAEAVAGDAPAGDPAAVPSPSASSSQSSSPSPSPSPSPSTSPTGVPPSSTSDVAPSGQPGEKSARHDCTGCGGAFHVHYRAEPGEPEEPAPVACPHCWEVNYIPIAMGATMTGEYRAQQV